MGRLLIVVFACMACCVMLSAGNDISVPAPDKSAHTQSHPYVRNWSLSTGEIQTIFNNIGMYGKGFLDMCVDPDGFPCTGFETPADSDHEYLFAGLAWIGGVKGSDTLVSIAAEGWIGGIRHFVPPAPSREFNFISDRAIWTIFCDTITDPEYTGIDPYDNRPHIPLNIRVVNRIHSFEQPPYNRHVVHDMTITNIGDEDISGAAVGIYIDGDVYHTGNTASGYMDDLTGSIQDAGIAYIMDNNGDPSHRNMFDFSSPRRAIAMRFLDVSAQVYDTAFNWWISSGNTDFDFGPQPVDEFGNIPCEFALGNSGTPLGSAGKYCILTTPGWDHDQIFTGRLEGWNHPGDSGLVIDFITGYDTRFLLSISGFDLPADSSVRIFYTLFTGEDVHIDPDNFDTLWDDPDAYLDGLNLQTLVDNAGFADSIVNWLRDPLLPTTGIYLPLNSRDSVILEWDPWVFPEVEGYEIYVYEVQSGDLPYPGVLPPWLEASSIDHYASVDRTYRYVFDDLNPGGFYIVNMAHRTAGGIGELSEPLTITPGARGSAPEIESEYIFFRTGKSNSAILRWEEPDDIPVDYYNIYRFDSWVAAESKYHAFFDTVEASGEISPVDSFLVDGTMYYYYAVTPYATVPAGTTEFADTAPDSTAYVITAVDDRGYESEFSKSVIVLEIPERDREILLLTNRQNRGWFPDDQEIAFVEKYSAILDRFDYSIYMCSDSIRLDVINTFEDLWIEFMRYRLVLVDDALGSIMRSYLPPQPEKIFEEYLAAGGRLAYCYSWDDFENLSPNEISVETITNQFIATAFRIDSMAMIGPAYFHLNQSPPYIDSLFGLQAAIPANTMAPYIAIDPAAPYTLNPEFWPEGSVWVPAAFYPGDQATVIYRAQSLFPESSVIQDLPNGVMTKIDSAITFIFGFHLWEMNTAGASDLISFMLSDYPMALEAGVILDSDSLHMTESFAVDPEYATLTIAFADSVTGVADIVASTIRINEFVEVFNPMIIDSHPDFDYRVLEADVFKPDLINSYMPLWDVKWYEYTVTAELTDGSPLEFHNMVKIVGRFSGDANNDGLVNIGDAIFLVRYLYGGEAAPDPLEAGDVNCDLTVDLADMVTIINYVFRGGPAPSHECFVDKSQ